MKEYQNMIYSKAWEASQWHGVPFEDMAQEAWAIAYEAEKDFDKDRSTFSTYLWNRLHMYLYNYSVYQNRRSSDCEYQDWGQNEFDKNYSRIEFMDFIDSATSETAKKVIDCIFKENSIMYSQHRPKITKQNLTKFLKKNGWSIKKINKIFAEIGQVLKEWQYASC